MKREHEEITANSSPSDITSTKDQDSISSPMGDEIVISDHSGEDEGVCSPAPKVEDPEDLEEEEGEDETPVCLICGETPCSLVEYADELEEVTKYVKYVVPDGLEEKTNTHRRYEAYRKFTELQYGPLGKGNRIPLPNCIQSYIRSLWPNDGKEDEYTGYKSH